MPRFPSLMILIPILLFSHYTPAAATPTMCPSTGQAPATFTLDGVALSVCTTFIEHPQFVVSEPGNAIQTAYATQDGPDQKEFMITTARYGNRMVGEDLPPANAATPEDVFRDRLRAGRAQQGGKPQTGLSLSLFGQAIAGDTSTVSLAWDGIHKRPVRITEWVIKAHNRLWIVRASQPVSSAGTTASIAQSDTALAETVLTGSDLNLASVNPVPTPRTAAALQTTAITDLNLPAPSWWGGPCDPNHYYYYSGMSSYPLGASYRGVAACGPRPWAGAPDVLVRFFSGAWGEYEWECVELSMRFMYLAYGIPPYPANGKDVVGNYQGSRMVKISNAAIGLAPQPGNVLSYYATCYGYGHTSVVTASSVDTNGNGSITIMEQNSSTNGAATLTVTNWKVIGDVYPISSWLHPIPLNEHTFLPLTIR